MDKVVADLVDKAVVVLVAADSAATKASVVDSVVVWVAADSVAAEVVAEVSEMAVAVVAECLTFLPASPANSLSKPFASKKAKKILNTILITLFNL